MGFVTCKARIERNGKARLHEAFKICRFRKRKVWSLWRSWKDEKAQFTGTSADWRALLGDVQVLSRVLMPRDWI